MLERWNDDKIDGLDGKVEDLDFRVAEIGQKLREERMQRTMLWAAVTIVVALLASGFAIVAAAIG